MAEDAGTSGPAKRERLAQRRKALGLTQKALADLLHVERSTVVRWERGETKPLPWIHPKLAKALRVSADRLEELLDGASSDGTDNLDTAREPAGPAGSATTPGRDGAAPTVPQQLPAAVADFTGRAGEIKTLTRLLEDAGGRPPGTVVISAIGGTAGVGKTALALHWAHQVAQRFPDGQLYVNLRGFAPSGTPATPVEVIRGFLDALGVPPQRIPSAADAQAGMYRSLLAGRKMLIVLDNARDEQQVRPLLPASPASLLLVTSRNQLTGLAAADGARLFSLDVLTHEEAVQLLTARIGHARAAAGPAAIAEIATLCACLPLALAVAAARAAARPGFPLAALAAELRDAAGRLDALDAGDPAASVRAVFSWSYTQLSTEAARMFRLLGLHPGPDITVTAAASLAATGEPGARRLLRDLTRAHLITEHPSYRYDCHDLLRAYAAAQSRAHDSEQDRTAATGRLLDHYLHTACHAAFLVHPGQEPVSIAPPSPGAVPERPADYQQALAWFEAEWPALLAAVSCSAKSGFDTHAWQIPWAIMPFRARRGYYQQWDATHRTALAAATRAGDVAGQAVSSRILANLLNIFGQHDQALGYARNSLELYKRAGNSLGEAKSHQNLAGIAERHGDFADALAHCQQALLLFRATGHQEGEVEMLNGTGWCHVLLGDYEQARAFCREALARNAEVGYRRVEPHIWDSLGYIERQDGDFAEAAACYERALALCREFGDHASEAEILLNLGDTHRAIGKLPQARQAWQQALAIYDDIQHPDADKVRAKLAGLPPPVAE
jgi:tetratricopeptide (TPR) repeat protein/transcriptional regulator with XRE-family HTH domain